MRIAGPDDLAAAHAGPGKQCREHARPVISAGSRIDLRRTSEFPDADNQCFVEQLPVIKVRQQCRQSLIERRQQPILELREITAMRIPVVHRAHISLHDRHAGLDQPPREQQRLPEGMSSITIARLG